MKVKELQKILDNYDGEMEVGILVQDQGNDRILECYDIYFQPKDVILNSKEQTSVLIRPDIEE